MSEHITSIPVLLSQNRHNISEVARKLNANRGTVYEHMNDKDCHNHIVIRGRLMVYTRYSKDA